MKFLLLLKDEEVFQKLSPEEQQSAIGKYAAWAKKLRDAGRFVDGMGLSPTGAVLKANDSGTILTDGIYVETKELIGGYFVYTADCFEEAVEIAKECPSLSYGGTVELRSEMDYRDGAS